MIRCFNPSQVKKLSCKPSTSTVAPRPVDGSQPSHTENTMINISPTQNVGNEKPSIDPAMMDFAANESGVNPAHSPNGNPSTMAMIIATSASSTVAGMRCSISCTAGTLEANDLPRSPVTAAFKK